MAKKILGTDLVKVFASPEGTRKQVGTLFWGDEVKLVATKADVYQIEYPMLTWDTVKSRYKYEKLTAEISRKTVFTDKPLLKVKFLDVGQGDGAIVETPAGHRLLIDGGEELNLRRYMFVAYAQELRTAPLHIDAIFVTHGDADHFAGLTELLNAYRRADSETGLKEPMVEVDRMFHNGIVKFSSASKKHLGRTASTPGGKVLTEIYEDPRDAPQSSLNKPFGEWVAALADTWKGKRKRPTVKRLAYGDSSAVKFLEAAGVTLEVLGPIAVQRNGKDALPWISDDSHTINGNSIVLRLKLGNVRFLFGADLNEASMESLVKRARTDGRSLGAEILKVPHHGSADFSPAMLDAVRPVVSIVSSGDESAAKEYIHPRAGLIGALGRFSRQTVDKPLVFVTEMVAFFERVSGVVIKGEKAGNNFYQKRSFGIVHVRTDGKRVLVATHSAKINQKEGYVFTVGEQGEIEFGKVTTS